jgi:hypothetical protein
MHRIFTHDGELFARTMKRVFGVELPVADRVTELNTDLTDFRNQPHARHCDSVILAPFLLEGRAGDHIVVVEAQLRKNEDKEYTWPYYVAFLRDKYRCDVTLLVVSNNPAAVEWARRPIISGLPGMPCLTVQAVVVGPDNTPEITDLSDACSDIGFTVLSALIHSHSGMVDNILEILAKALGRIDSATAATLGELTEAGLTGTHALNNWRKLMDIGTYTFVGEQRAKGIAQGLAQGRAEAIVQILDQRGVSLTKTDLERIESCTDMETLSTWLNLALIAATAAELFAATERELASSAM